MVSKTGKVAGYILLSSTLVFGALAFADWLQKDVRQDREQGRIYVSLKDKVNKLADKNSDNRIDLFEARDVMIKSYSFDTNRADDRLLRGYNPTIRDMQNYLKAEGKFDEKADDSLVLEDIRKDRCLPFNLSL